MNCPYCQNTNPEQNRFCGYCGKQLLPISDTHPDVAFESARQTLIEQAVHDFEKKLSSVQMDALERFQGQISRLIKLLLWPLLITFSVLAFMGYNEWKDFKEKYTDAKEVIQAAKASTKAKMKQLIKQTETQIQNAERKLNELEEKSGNIGATLEEIKGHKEEIEGYKNSAQVSKNDAAAFRKDAERHLYFAWDKMRLLRTSGKW